MTSVSTYIDNTIDPQPLLTTEPVVLFSDITVNG